MGVKCPVSQSRRETYEAAHSPANLHFCAFLYGCFSQRTKREEAEKITKPVFSLSRSCPFLLSALPRLMLHRAFIGPKPQSVHGLWVQTSQPLLDHLQVGLVATVWYTGAFRSNITTGNVCGFKGTELR